MLRGVSVQRVKFVPELEVKNAVLASGAVEEGFWSPVDQAGTLHSVGEVFASDFAHLQAHAISYPTATIVLANRERVFSLQASPSEPGETGKGLDFCVVAL